LNKDDDSLLNAIFPPKENQFYDLSRTKPFTGEIEYLYMPENVSKQESNNEKEKVHEIPEYFTLSKIKELLTSKLSPEIIKELNQKIFLEKNLQKVESEIDDQVLLGKKRNKKDKITFNEEDKKDIGRKKKDDNSSRKHNKYCVDNIIKKIKLKLLEDFLNFGNKVINENLDKNKLIVYNKILRDRDDNIEKFEDLIKMIDYKYIGRLNKKKDLSILYMPFKELFSKNIIPRYSKLKPDSNKIIIEKLLQEECDKANIAFVLNMKFKDWIDIFTYRKRLNSINNLEYGNLDNLSQYFEYADNLILNIYRKNKKDNYLLYFMIYLYNYERWFSLKIGRTRSSKNIKLILIYFKIYIIEFGLNPNAFMNFRKDLFLILIIFIEKKVC